MGCHQCQGIEQEFNETVARRELVRYRRKGATGTTRMLVEALKAEDVRGRTLLDVGGGIGVIQHELLAVGAERVVGVDASAAYLATSMEEARRRGHENRVTHIHGDFAQLAADVPPADIVTLDRVICCYHDMPALVAAAATRARTLLGAVYPRDTWWNRVGISIFNLVARLRRSPFRTFIHPPQEIDAIVRRHGLAPRHHAQTFIWRVAVYVR